MTLAQAFLFIVYLLAVSAAPYGFNDTATICVPSTCLEELDCVCTSSSSPLSVTSTPQFVIFTSDDSVTDFAFTNYYEPLLFGRRNPDGNPISGTFYVPHEYTDYERVNDLYNAGFEIGVNSITKTAMTEYWASATLETLTKEFGGGREIVSTYANIPIDAIRGARTPNLQINGNVTFQAYLDSGITYDNSWPSLSSDKIYPYTLDFLSSQTCSIGVCPNASFPGLWVLPINDFLGPYGTECSTLLGCNANGTATEIYDWLKQQFEISYLGSRAPVTLLVNSAWFLAQSNAFAALESFLDYLGTLDDVFLISASQAIEWRRNPVALSNYTSTIEVSPASCNARVCTLSFGEHEIRYMKSCVTCPFEYPWID